MLGRDHFGICPLFYTRHEDTFVFGSEIKSLLQVPGVLRAVDMKGLDQILSFPSNVSPTTLFKGISSIEPGHYAVIRDGTFTTHEYWNLDYPDVDNESAKQNESYYVEGVNELLLKSVNQRLNADVPVGFYLSGGLDSSLLGGIIRKLKNGDPIRSFSICFSESSENRDINEQRFQRILSRHINSTHNELEFNWDNFGSRLRDVVYHSECALKESYNICSLVLSKQAKDENVKVVLCGEGADELFGGYAGYKFDRLSFKNGHVQEDLNQIQERQLRKVLWGDPDFIYEKEEHEFKSTKKALYSDGVNAQYADFDCTKGPVVDLRRLNKKHVFHKRSFLDFKLRLAGHLIADHGDRMTMANGIEGRYPFLDVELIEFCKEIPPDLMMRGMTEKYILKKIGERYIPKEIVDREKFGFVAPGSPQLLRNNNDWVHDILSYDSIKKRGFFNPDTIERLRKMYTRENFNLNPSYDVDLLMIVITFNLFLEVFEADSFR